MAADISTVKTTIVTDGGNPSNKGTVQSSSSGINFSDMIRKNGIRVDGSLNILSKKAGITGVSERSETSEVAIEQPHDNARNHNDNGGSRADGDERSERVSDRYASSHPDRSNDYTNDRSQASSPQIADRADNSGDHSQRGDHSGETANRDDSAGHSSDNDASSNNETSANETADTADSGDGEQASAKGETATTTSTAKQLFNTLLENSQGNAIPGQANGQANGQVNKNAESGITKTNTNEGLNTAIASLGKQDGGASASTKINKSAPNSANAQAQDQGQRVAQTQNTATAASQTVSEGQVKGTPKAAEQAAQISKMVGTGNKIDVSVSVIDEKAKMVSRPSTTLATASVLAGDRMPASLRDQQAKGTNNATGQAQVQQVTGQTANSSARIQQAAQQASVGQSQSTNTVAIGAKGPAQASSFATGAQAAQSGNSETPVVTAPGSTTATQQAQQTSSTQVINANRFTSNNPALTDQVSVQISKAINAGNDKISIQLKPADMGRVDVQMEVGQDGRISAVISADNKSTMDLLQKDAKELQQALQQAGLQLDNDSLSFNLREQRDGQMANNNANGGVQETDENMDGELSLKEELAGIDKNIITDNRIDVRA